MIHVVRDLALSGTADVDALVASETLTLGGAAEASSNLTLSAGIEIPLTAAGASLTVGGTLTFSGAATVVLEDPAFERLDAGDHDLFAATEIAGLDLGAVRLDASEVSTRRTFSLAVETDDVTGKTTAVKLRVAKKALLLIIR